MASINRTDNCLTGSDPEYDYQGDGWEAVGISLGRAPPMMVILWFQVYTLCRVDRAIRIAVFMNMDIPMSYDSLD